MPYWKPQWYDEITMAWREIQVVVHDPDAAVVIATQKAPSQADRFRAIRVDHDGRWPEPETR